MSTRGLNQPDVSSVCQTFPRAALICDTVSLSFRSCPAHLEAGLTRVVLEETRNHFHGNEDGGAALNDPASIELRADMADSPAMPLAAAGGQSHDDRGTVEPSCKVCVLSNEN